MAERRLVGLLAAVVVLAGCIPFSVHPFHYERDVEFEEWLLGEWDDDDEEGGIRVERAGPDGYRVTVAPELTDDGVCWVFVGHLFELGDRLFLDLMRADSLDDLTDRLDAHGAKLDAEAQEAVEDFLEPLGAWAFFQVPAHFFVQLERDGDTLRYAWMDTDWLEDAMEAKKVRIDHLTLPDDRILLTASTRKLRRFVKKHAGNAEAYGDWTELCRKKP